MAFGDSFPSGITQRSKYGVLFPLTPVKSTLSSRFPSVRLQPKRNPGHPGRSAPPVSSSSALLRSPPPPSTAAGASQTRRCLQPQHGGQPPRPPWRGRDGRVLCTCRARPRLPPGTPRSGPSPRSCARRGPARVLLLHASVRPLIPKGPWSLSSGQHHAGEPSKWARPERGAAVLWKHCPVPWQRPGSVPCASAAGSMCVPDAAAQGQPRSGPTWFRGRLRPPCPLADPRAAVAKKG